MSIIIEKDDAVAANRRVPCRIFLSDGTSPDTGALNDAVVMGTNSLATFSVNSTLRGVNANNGMYCIELTASEVSKVGAHPLYHTVGDFCQHIATICVVQSNPYSTMSNYDPAPVWNASRSSFTGPTTMGMSQQIISSRTCGNVGDINHIRLSSNETGQDDAYNGMGISVMMRSGFWQMNVISDYTGSNNSAWCRESWLSIPRSGDTYIIWPQVDWKNISVQTLYASASTASSYLAPINHSGASVEILTGGIQTTSVGKGSYSGVSVEVKTGGIQVASVGVGNYSGMSVEVKAKGIAVASIETVAIYSALTIGGVDNITPRVYSGVSVEVKAGGIQTTSIGVGSYSGVSVEVKTGGIQVASIAAGAYSGRSFEVTTGGIQVVSMGKGNYSGVSVEVTTGGIQVASIAAGNYSARSFEVTTGGIQTVSVGKGNYSGVSQEILTGGIQTTSIGVGNYSGVSVEVKSSGIVAGSLGAAAITSAKFAASAIDAAAVATDATVEIADALLGRNIAGGSSTGRTVSEALYPLRNRSLIEGSVLTVYTVDDVTSSWTATVSTGTLPIAGIDPLGP